MKKRCKRDDLTPFFCASLIKTKKNSLGWQVFLLYNHPPNSLEEGYLLTSVSSSGNSCEVTQT